MLSIDPLAGVSSSATTGLVGQLADKLLADAASSFGAIDTAALGGQLDRLAGQDADLGAAVRQEVAQRLPMTDRAAVEASAHRPSSLDGLSLGKDAYLAGAKELWRQVEGDPQGGFKNNADVAQAGRVVAAAPSTAAGDVTAAADPGLRG